MKGTTGIKPRFSTQEEKVNKAGKNYQAHKDLKKHEAPGR